MSKDTKCFFCGNECEIYTAPLMHNVKEYRCKFCGSYLIHRLSTALIPGINKMENKFKIACILNERRLKGQPGVALSDKTDENKKVCGCPVMSVGELLCEFPKKASEFLNRTILNLNRLAKQPFEMIMLDLEVMGDCLHLFRKGKKESHAFLRELENEGLIRFNRVPAGVQLTFFP